MESTRQEQPAFHRTHSTGTVRTPAPLPTRTTSVLLQNPAEDVIPYSRLVALSISQSTQQPIPEHASPAYFDIKRELTPRERHFSPECLNSIAAPPPENRSFMDPLRRLMNPSSPSGRPKNSSTFQPPYPSRLPHFAGALVPRSQSVFARPHLPPTSPVHTPNPFLDVHYMQRPQLLPLSPQTTSHTTPIPMASQTHTPVLPNSPSYSRHSSHSHHSPYHPQGHVSPHHSANDQGSQPAPIFRPHPGHIYPQPREIPSYLHPAPSGPNQFGRTPVLINTFTQIPTLPSGPVPQSRPHPGPPFPHIGALPNGPPSPPRPSRPPGPPPPDGGPWPQPGFPWNPYYQFPFAYPQAIPDGDSDAVKPDKFTGKDPHLL